MIHVLSTGNRPAHPRNLTSVRDQTHPHAHHVRVDPGVSYSENLYGLVNGLSVDDIIACVDADDWLDHPCALERVAQTHASGAWVTYGSYKFADGRAAPWQRAYHKHEDPRSAPWLASHLKSFRAGLVNRLRFGDLDLPHGRDQALMLPLLEMAGDRAVFIPEVLYVYNWGESFEFSANREQLDEEARDVASIRAREPYPGVRDLDL